MDVAKIPPALASIHSLSKTEVLQWKYEVCRRRSQQLPNLHHASKHSVLLEKADILDAVRPASDQRPSACRNFGNVDVTIINKSDIDQRAVLIRCAAEVTVSMRRH
ncbi:hypothetical protein [Bradyrhizobium ottawaense]|uniref:hypothetical protein n=1 Tax=Bradyrhizobium ottawaense TaxID=931866 RepID=UPI0012603346|nr:hypothetical protein [Bradyrhizobium ottawaense]MBR1326045.1 hypothetical protein [Bradyrhizobium ottawaense]